MRKKIFILFLILTVMVQSVTASYVTINVDKATNAAMTESYGIQLAIENKNTKYLDEVLNHYTDINISTTGIFTQKWLERKALANAGVLATQENYYYQHIGNLITRSITPKLIACGGLLIKEPQNALYWGPWLIQTTQRTEELCNVFTTVVTNGKLRFQDIPGFVLLTVNPKFANIVDLMRIGGDINWQQFFDRIGDFGKDISADDIYDDMKNIGGSIASAGKAVLDGDLAEASKLGHIFKTTPREILDMFKYFKGKYDQYKNARSVSDVIKAYLGEDLKIALKNLFVTADLNTTKYIDDYLNSFTGEYYRQRWYIIELDQQTHMAPRLIYEEYFDSQNQNLNTFREHMEAIRDKYSAQADYYTNTEGRVQYVIKSDEPIYYTEPDDRKMNGCSSVNFIANCTNEGTTLMDGDFAFKRNRKNHDGKGLKLPEDEADAMGNNGSSTGADDPTYQLNARLEQINNQIAELEKQIEADTERQSKIIDEIRQANLAGNNQKALELTKEYDGISSKNTERRKQISYLRTHRVDDETGDMMQAGKEQIEEAIKDYQDDVQSGDVDTYRIQNIMNKLQTVFDLSWNVGGKWAEGSNEAVFTRTAYCGETKSTVTFTATLKADGRYRKKFGIRYHRELLKVHYKLTGGGNSGENIIESMELDPDSSKAEANKQKVQEEMRKLQQKYPHCQISVEYFYNKSQQVDDGGDEPIHLMWVGDRVRVAQEIGSQLLLLDADLSCLYRALKERETLMDFFKRAASNFVTRARRATIAQVCYGDWCGTFESIQNAYTIGYNNALSNSSSDNSQSGAKESNRSAEAVPPEQKGEKR